MKIITEEECFYINSQNKPMTLSHPDAPFVNSILAQFKKSLTTTPVYTDPTISGFWLHLENIKVDMYLDNMLTIYEKQRYSTTIAEGIADAILLYKPDHIEINVTQNEVKLESKQFCMKLV